MPDTVSRTIQLKQVKYRSGRRRNFHPSPIHELFRDVAEEAPTVGDRHEPKDIDRDSGQLHCFSNFIRPARPGIFFEYCTYRPGTVPMQMLPDLEAQDIDLDAQPITDEETGEPLEVVQAAQVLLFGQIALVETVRGNGGVARLSTYLTDMIRTYVDENHPSILLADVSGRELHETIQRGGGIQQVYMDLVHNPGPGEPGFARLLSPLRRRLNGTRLLRVFWKAQDIIPEDDVLEAFEELHAQEGGIDNVVVFLRDGNKIQGFDRYRLRTTVDVTDDGYKNPSRLELRQEMRGYLAELRQVVNGSRVVDDDGELVVIAQE